MNGADELPGAPLLIGGLLAPGPEVLMSLIPSVRRLQALNENIKSDKRDKIATNLYIVRSKCLFLITTPPYYE